MNKIFLDDLRPAPAGYVLLKSSQEAIEYVKQNGCSNHFSFDHDLGKDDTTMVFLKWLINEDLDNSGSIIPEDFTYIIHSANPVGRENIDSLLTSYLKFKNTTSK